MGIEKLELIPRKVLLLLCLHVGSCARGLVDVEYLHVRRAHSIRHFNITRTVLEQQFPSHAQN